MSQLTKNSRLMRAFQNWQSRFSNFLSLITVFSPYVFWITLAHSMERCISSPFRFSCPLPDIPPFFRKMYTPLPPWHPLQENTRFYDDALESGRLKAINIKPWKPLTYGNCMETICLKYWMCLNRYHSDNYHSCWHWMQLPSW